MMIQQVIFYIKLGKVALVFELMEQNLYEFIKTRKDMSMQKAKYFMYQLLKSIAYMHSKGIFHRNIKPENILISGDSIKISYFNSCAGIHDGEPYTEYIATRWYRAP